MSYLPLYVGVFGWQMVTGPIQSPVDDHLNKAKGFTGDQYLKKSLKSKEKVKKYSRLRRGVADTHLGNFNRRSTPLVA